MLGKQELAANEDVFPFRAQWISPTELLYTADGTIKRRPAVADATSGKTPASSSTIAFTATLTLTPANYARKKRDFNQTTAKRALGIMHPRASRDGTRVAFAALGDLWVMTIGGKPERVTNDAAVDTEPAWSPDGTRLVFSSDRAVNGNMDLYVRDLKTGQDRRLTTSTEAEMGGTWSPDGKWIAFTSNTAFKQGETYFVAAEGGTPRKLLDRIVRPRLRDVVGGREDRDRVDAQGVFEPLSRGHELHDGAPDRRREAADDRAGRAPAGRQAVGRRAGVVARRQADGVRERRPAARHAGGRDRRSNRAAARDHEGAGGFTELGGAESDPLHRDRSLEAGVGGGWRHARRAGRPDVDAADADRPHRGARRASRRRHAAHRAHRRRHRHSGPSHHVDRRRIAPICTRRARSWTRPAAA